MVAAMVHRSNVIHIRCGAHIINIIVTAGITHKSFKPTLAKLHKLNMKIHGSDSLLTYLSNQTKINGESDLKPIIPVPTRWNSEHDSMGRAFELKKSFDATATYLIKEKKASDIEMLTEEEWNNVESIIKMLEPFKQG
jgi:hypothetical protein